MKVFNDLSLLEVNRNAPGSHGQRGQIDLPVRSVFPQFPLEDAMSEFALGSVSSANAADVLLHRRAQDLSTQLNYLSQTFIISTTMNYLVTSHLDALALHADV